MTKISELPKAAAALTGMERVPGLQGDTTVGLPLFAMRGTIPRGEVLALMQPMAADLSATSDADPGAGKVRWNNGTQASATVLYVDDVDGAAGDVAAALAAVNAGGFLYLQGADVAHRAKWQKWQVDLVADATGYTKVNVTLLASGDAFEADDPLLLSIQQPDPAAALTREPNIQAVTSAGTVTPTFDNDLVKITAQAAALTLANPTGTPIPGLGMAIRIKDNGTARAITYGTQYRAVGVTLPATTVVGKVTYLGMIYNADETTWDVVAVAQQA